MIRRPPRSTHCISSAASDVYKRQGFYSASQERQRALKSFVLKSFRYAPNTKMFEHVLKARARGERASRHSAGRRPESSISECYGNKRIETDESYVNKSFVVSSKMRETNKQRKKVQKSVDMSDNYQNSRGKSIDMKLKKVILEATHKTTSPGRTEAKQRQRNARRLHMTVNFKVFRGKEDIAESKCNTSKKYK
eukprot:TRINITY_DN4271_c0_g1_i1.p1 TRINITY_DN4271_c0_g1~~TRINITY_DN4271_c0_g1_i1.p1  ORF type:complete len:194 (+),score=41.22 TRINITY_DN4271_c0_g1_i1:30-611(+)